MIVTPFSLLLWDNGQPDGNLPPLPVAYMRDRERCAYSIVAVPGEALTFYTASWEGAIPLAQNFADLRLGIETGGGIIENVAAMLKHDVPGGTGYNVYSTLVFPALASGSNVKLRIYSAVTGQAVLRSAPLLVGGPESLNSSVYLRHRHDRSFYGIRWHDLPGFHQAYRVNLSLIDEQNESERDIYKESATGQRRAYNSSMDKVVKMESYYFDSMAHDAISVLFENEIVLMNGRSYILKSAYRRNFDPLTKIYKGEAEFYDQGFAGWNRCNG